MHVDAVHVCCCFYKIICRGENSIRGILTSVGEYNTVLTMWKIIPKCVDSLKIPVKCIETPQIYLESYSSPIHPQTASCENEWTRHWAEVNHAGISNKVQEKSHKRPETRGTASAFSQWAVAWSDSCRHFLGVYHRAAACHSSSARRHYSHSSFGPLTKTWGLINKHPAPEDRCSPRLY